MRRIPALACLVVVCPALAAVEHLAQPGDPRPLDSVLASDTVVPVAPGTASPAALSALRFIERNGGQWAFRGDPRSGRLAVVFGSGVPLATPSGGPSVVQAADIEPLVRAFIERNADWLVPQRGALAFDAERSQARRDGALISVRYDWRVDGIPVEGAGVFVGINHGAITRVAARMLGEIPIDTTPAIDAPAARRIALIHSGDAEYRRVEEPRLLIQPEDTPDGRRVFRLVWLVRHITAGRFETWETRVDAATGAVVGFRDANVYGRAVGGIYPNSIGDHDETVVPFPGLAVEVDGRTKVTDSAGRYGYTGGTAITRLDGAFFDTNCVGCDNPPQPFERKQIGTGRLELGRAGHDHHGNGVSTAADRNTFYHMTQARRVAAGWLPGLRWLARTRFPSNVNLPLECNAFFDGQSVNFFRSGGGCNNSGLIRDVIQHEWGHGLDGATLIADGPSGEGTADVTALNLGHSPMLGPGFWQDGDPLRVLDATVNPLGSLTRTRVNQGACERPLGGISFHCAGLLFGQAAWELSQALVDRHGYHTGWRVSERLFFESLPDAGSLYPETTMSMYDAYLQADDDDGNLANGTPHAAEIHAAFAAHEIAGDALPATEPCAGPPQPAVDVVAGCRSVTVSWDAVPGTARYRVLRSELRTGAALFPVARVPGEQTGFVDTQVAPGFDYAYVVLATDAGGCESTIEDPVPARLPARPELTVSAVDVTDAARGNRSGFADPGEEIDLQIVLSNVGSLDADAVDGTLRSLSAGVEIVADRVNWPAIPAGQSRAAFGAFRLSTVDEGIACGDQLRLAFVPDDAAACADEISYFSVRLGQPLGHDDYVCDPAPACFTPPTFAGLQAAVPGNSCGEVVLTWQPAVTHCVDATLTYDIHRNDAAGFVPGLDNVVATGHRSTTFVDSGLVPGATYHYLVRAYDSRAADDGNNIVHAVTAPAGPDIRAPIFAGLGSATPGTACGEVRLIWPAAVEACSPPVTYDVYRSAAPDFEPDAGRLIATTADTGFTDFAPYPGRDYTYFVRARDAAGNPDRNLARRTAQARNLDRVVIQTSFEISDGNWKVVEPNDATRGNWEWGDPEGSEIQSEDDATPLGSKAWITGLPNYLPDGSNNDVDQGATTLLSFRYDLGGTVDPVVRYMRWFTNDRRQNPGDPRDSFLVHVSNDDGATWRLIEEVGAGTPLAWVPVEIPLAGILRPTAKMRFRFTAADPGFSLIDASGVEAGIDEFSLIDRGQGCAGYPATSAVDEGTPAGIQPQSLRKQNH